MLILGSKIEGEGHEAGHGGEHADAPTGEVAEDAHRVPLLLFIFEQHLAAGAAGRGLAELSRSVASDDGECFIITHFWPPGRGGEDGCALGAEAGGVGGVLLVGTAHNTAVFQSQGRTHVEVRIGRIGTVGGFDGGLHQLAVGSGKLLDGVIFLIVNV